MSSVYDVAPPKRRKKSSSAGGKKDADEDAGAKKVSLPACSTAYAC